MKTNKKFVKHSERFGGTRTKEDKKLEEELRKGTYEFSRLFEDFIHWKPWLTPFLDGSTLSRTEFYEWLKNNTKSPLYAQKIDIANKLFGVLQRNFNNQNELQFWVDKWIEESILEENIDYQVNLNKKILQLNPKIVLFLKEKLIRI